MKAIFMGAPEFAVPILRALSRTGAEIVAVYTRAPKRGGRRGLEIKKTPVHVAAEDLGLRVEAPLTLRNAEIQQSLRELRADIAIVAAYGLLLPAEALAAARLGCFNLHGSLLPRWRGAAPVQRAIMAGDAETGVSIMKMGVGLDTGPIAGEMRAAISPTETAGELTSRLSQLAAQTLGDNWSALVQGRLHFTPQASAGVEYAHKIDKSEAAIDWTADADLVRRRINGLSPFPGAFTIFPGDGGPERLKILRAEFIDRSGAAAGEILDERFTVACGRGAIRALLVQRAGRNVMSGDEFMRSGVLPIGVAFAPHSSLA
ncbi:MAG: methionyl-tRNA formyltransferase [Pseudomonadota bacterium]|nr:methionyl-tRNA formyltransferase [Pseudomonadota bacterium]